MITVMFLETSLRIGGAEMMLTQLIERLDRDRFRPILCCLYEEGVLAARVRRLGIPVYERLAAGRWNGRTGLRLWRLLRRERVQALFLINQPITQFWGILCSVLAGVPVRVAAIGSTGKLSRIRRRLWVNRLTFPWTTRVTAKSQTHKAYLIEHERIVPQKLEIIPNGVDLTRFEAGEVPQQLWGSLGLPSGTPVVGIVAMLRPEKAHEVFLQAAASVLASVRTARFLIIGDGPERPRLEEITKDLGIERSVQFLGARQDVPALVSLLDVAVLCSRPVVETMSNAILEYMAVGKPVVATRVGSVPEQVQDGLTGFLVEPGDWQALGRRIAQLLQDPSLARRMGQAGRARVEAEYSVQRMVEGHERLFERLLDKRLQALRRSLP